MKLHERNQLLQKRVVSGRNGAKTLKGFENLIFTIKYDTLLNAQIYADAIKVIVEQINQDKWEYNGSNTV